jgi:thiamine transport system substrate-binding protein
LVFVCFCFGFGWLVLFVGGSGAGEGRRHLLAVRTNPFVLLLFVFSVFIVFCLCRVASADTNKSNAIQDQPNSKNLAPQTVLRVATYRSFASSYGPGSTIKSEFEKNCKCTVEWLLSDDAGGLLLDLKTGKNKDADVMVGFDQFMTTELKSTGKLAEYKSVGKYSVIAASIPSPYQPVDFGYFSVMVDMQKVQRHPDTFASFLADRQFAKSFAAQDPRTSSPGMGLLVWLRTISKDQKAFEEKLQDLKAQALTFSKGWSESYGLFTKGEVKSVFSYVTSELYHRISEGTDRYRALRFVEGHPLQIEYAAYLKSTKKVELAKEFMAFLLKPEVQKNIAQQNWMFPAGHDALALLPARFSDTLKEIKTLKVDPQLYDPLRRKELVNSWRSAFR